MQENVAILMDFIVLITFTSDLLDGDWKAIDGLEDEAVSRICKMTPIKIKLIDRRLGYLFLILLFASNY